MTTMNILTALEIAEGDRFFTHCNVEDNRCSAGNGKAGAMPLDCSKPWLDHRLTDEPGEITGYGLDYTKVRTKWGEVCVPWQATGTASGALSGIYDFIALGVPVTVSAERVYDKAYSWLGKSISVHIGKNIGGKDTHFIYNTGRYINDNTVCEWSEWVDYTDKQVGQFLGVRGNNLRRTLEENLMDNTFIKFTDNPDCGKLMTVTAMKWQSARVKEVIDQHFNW